LTNNKRELADIIKEAREKKGISQRELARQIGVGNNTIARLENGERKSTNALTLKKMANVLNLDLRELMTIAGFSEEDIETTIDPEMEEYMARQNTYKKLFSSYFANNDITKTEWYNSLDKNDKETIKKAIDSYFNN
jgi:transcriptional regulator with XRE-family HTH domain